MDRLPGLKGAAERWQSLAREQKISAGILAFCGVIAIGLSMQRIQSGITDPFTVTKTKFEQAKQTVATLSPEQTALEESKRIDTDGDGISDYDEEHVFGTSPYLRDTDGDGIPDNVELAQGTNPNCAEGQACDAKPIDLSTVSSSTGLDFIQQVPGGSANELYASFQNGMNAQAGNIYASAGVTSTPGQALVRDPVAIRKVLKDSGQFDATMVDQITDAQLLQIYDEAMVEAAKNQSTTSTGAGSVLDSLMTTPQ